MDPRIKKAFPVILLLLGIGLASAFIVSFLELSEEVFDQELQLFDQLIILTAEQLQTPAINAVAKVITELGSIWFLSVLSVVIIIVLWRRFKDKWGIVYFILGAAGSGLLTALLKNYYRRDRPSLDEAVDGVGFSFPSGHSVGSLVIYGFLTYFFVRSNIRPQVKGTVFTAALLVILSIGFSRIYLGVHYTSDVLAGYIAGTTWLLLCLMALEWTQWRSRANVRPVRAFRNLVRKIWHAAQR